MPSKEYVDTAVVIPLEEEWEAFQSIFQHKQHISDHPLIEEFESGIEGFRVIAVLQDRMGKTAASTATGEILSRFDVGLIICLGIAGGIDTDYGIGDVCYSTKIIDVYDNSKVSEGGKSGVNLSLSPTFYETPISIYSALSLIRTRRDLGEAHRTWQNERVSTESGKSLQNTHQIKRAPKSASVIVACGAVSASSQYNKKIKELDRKTAIIETEAGGVFESAKQAARPALAIRGISDMADSNKSHLEADTSGAARLYAATNASSFLRLQITRNPVFRSAIASLDSSKGNAYHTTPQITKDDLIDYLESLQSHIRHRLGELSPEYKLVPKGYFLPVPRVRLVTYDPEQRQHELSDPLEIAACINESSHAFVSVGSNYPEKSLAWLVADELLRHEHNGKQVLPIVVIGRDVKPPKGSLELAADLPGSGSLPDLNTRDVQYVVIFDGLPITSRSRMQFIVNQVSNHPETRFIFIDRTPSNVVLENEFIARLGCRAYDLCDISFQQMSYFVERNFEVAQSEANVIALRLQKTFRRFKLSAHPSYFAGIPQNTISQLIQVNRRAELMELAVVGFLSFVVAGDRASVQLSRKTRERFLKQLVVDIRVHNNSYDEPALIAYVQAFAKQHDFDIEPLRFISSFVDHNILNFSHGSVAVSLPFIEHYLLASALKEDQNLAREYFVECNVPDIDVRTFDLYCEIGPSEEIVNWAIDGLRSTRSALSGSLSSSQSTFLRPDMDSLIGVRRVKAEALEKRIRSLTRSIRDSRDETGEKQAQLDAFDRIASHVHRTNPPLSSGDESSGEGEGADIPDPVVDLGQAWELAVTLLGSGAEYLDASSKRDLVSEILRGMDALISRVMNFMLDIDYVDLKRQILDDEELKEALQEPAELLTNGDVEKFVSETVDGIRAMLVSNPFRKLVHMLCDGAREKVLATSVRAAPVDSGMGPLLQAIWLTDIDVAQGKAALDKELKMLPETDFARIVVASHFLERVYWIHSSQQDRLYMLDRATSVLEKTSIRIEKQELKRLVKKSAKESDDQINADTPDK